MPCGLFPHPPRLAPDVRLSPHPAQHLRSFSIQRWSLCFHFSSLHRRSSVFDPISPTYPRRTARAQLARSLGTLFAAYLCTPYFLKLGAFTISPHPAVHGFPVPRLLCPIRLPARPRSFVRNLFLPLSTLLDIPCRLSRVRHRGLRRNAVGGVLLTAPSALCGFLVVTRGRSGLPVLSLAMHGVHRYDPYCHRSIMGSGTTS